jgi:hypothetical protein
MKIKQLPAAMGLVWAMYASPGFAQTFSLYTLESTDKDELNRVQEAYEIVGRDGSTYQIYVPIQKAHAFQKENPRALLKMRDVDAEWKAPLRNQPRLAAGYHDWQGVQDYMANAVETYPDLATRVVYGKTKGNRELSYLKLTSKKGHDKPKLFLDAATHGDELISTEVLLNLVTELLGGYDKDNRLTAMLDQTEIYVSFVVNPDGFVNQNRYEGWSDPNRSYPWPGNPKKVPTPSIQALMNLFEAQRFAGSITFHAYGKLLMYPWAYTEDALDNGNDRSNFQSLTDDLALENHYKHGSIAETIYVAQGSSVDYYYWKFGTQALAVELATTKVPPANAIPSVVNEAREMVWSFIEHFYKN